MEKLREVCRKATTNKWFEWSITIVILVNALFIGVETYAYFPTIALAQKIILGIFTIEILMRFIARDNLKNFFTNGWNIFDLTLVLIGYIPEDLFANAQMMMALRVLRVFRVLRLLRASKEIKLIVSVLVRSMISMFANVILFLIFIYLFAIVGVSLFKLPDPATLSDEDKLHYEQFMELAPNAPSNSPDPFGTLHEAMFTLFRELTGEDWTDLRYNHITAYECGVIKVNPRVITGYHVSWFVLAAFLLLNLVTGAIINNYQNVKDEQDKSNSDFMENSDCQKKINDKE
ncbi:MAG: ion transporter [Bacteroidales bacterium]|nr:ion transporter [Bacteroidales bacterium]